VDDALLYQLVNALRNTLDGQPFRDGNEMVLNSLIFACTKLVGARLTPGYSGPESAYLTELFWLAVAVLEIAEGSTYPLSVTFLEVCLKTLSISDVLACQHLPAFLLQARKGLEPSATSLDEIIGINFSRSFSFSLAALLAKGMKSQGSRDSVRSAARVLLDLSSKHRITVHEPPNGLQAVKPTISFEVLPYLAILIPTMDNNDELVDYLNLTGLNGEDFRKLPPSKVWKKLFSDGSVEEMLDNETSLLLLSLTGTILASTDREKELLLLYSFFDEAAPNTRSTFPYVYVFQLWKTANFKVRRNDSKDGSDDYRESEHAVVANDRINCVHSDVGSGIWRGWGCELYSSQIARRARVFGIDEGWPGVHDEGGKGQGSAGRWGDCRECDGCMARLSRFLDNLRVRSREFGSCILVVSMHY